MDIALLTPIEVEYLGFRSRLQQRQRRVVEGKVYETGIFKGTHHTYRVAIRLTGSKNKEIALAAQHTMQHFQPAIAILGGIAGGVKDVEIGSIVVATHAYGYESGKIDITGNTVARPEVIEYDADLIELLRAYTRDQWNATNGRVVFGPIASGDKVIASTQSPLYRFIKQYYNNTIAVEMESIGFATTCKNRRSLRFLNIRGISDLLDGKTQTDGEGGQELAVERVVRFVFGFLEQLDFNSIKLHIMDSKTLASKLAKMLFQKEQVIDLLNDFQTNNDPTLQALWQQVKSLLQAELSELRADPQDEETLEDARSDARRKLRRRFDENANLKAQVERSLKSTGTTITNQKNTLNNSTIHAGGNVQIGDTDSSTHIGSQVNHNEDIGSQYNISGNNGSIHIGDIINIQQVVASAPAQPVSPSIRSANMEQIQNLLSQSRIKEAIEEMLRWSKGESTQLHNQVILLAGRWNRLQNQRMMGIISYQQGSIEENRIVADLLSVIEKYIVL